jgi:hypothetical protein
LRLGATATLALAFLALRVGAPAAAPMPVAPDSALVAASTAAADSVQVSPMSGAYSDPGEPSHGPWYYEGRPYGSEALVHPLRLIINGGFGILQFDNRDNRLGDVRFKDGWHRVWADLESPVRTIELHGWNDFLRREVLPISSSRRDAQYWPNYTLHLVGGGMSYVMMREWFEQHDVPHARVWASATLTGYHLLNEVVEADHRPGPTTDAIADLMVFDPAGVLMFSHEGVNRFFSGTLHLRDWSNQPAFDPVVGTIENQGQNFSIKYAIPRTEHWSLFYYFGNHGEVGLSYRRPDGSAISVGGGLRAKELIDLGNGIETADLVPSYGFFYDRNGSLLCSVTAANSSRYRLRMNVYPGLVRVGGHTAGVFVLLGRHGETITGVHLIGFPIGAAGKLRD